MSAKLFHLSNACISGQDVRVLSAGGKNVVDYAVLVQSNWN